MHLSSSLFSWHLPSMLFLEYKTLFHGHQFSWHWVHVPEFLPCQFKEWSWVFYKRDCPRVYFFDKISAAELLVSKSFLVLLMYNFFFFFFFFYFFFHLWWLDAICFKYYQIRVILFLSKRSDVVFLIWQFYYFTHSRVFHTSFSW